MDGVCAVGKLVVQAFQKIPGVTALFGTESLHTFELVAGILIILCYLLAAGCIIFGIVKWATRRISQDAEGNQNKKPGYWLVGGLIAGGVLILLPSLILIIGSTMGEIVNTVN